MPIDYSGFAAVGGNPKPEPRQRTKNREKRVKTKTTAEVRQYVFARERNLDRVSRYLPAESMHEIQFRSQGGKVSRKNSIAVHGDGVQGIHGLLQRHEITVEIVDPMVGAEGTLIFTARSQAAADLMRIKVGESIESAPMVQVEMAE